MRNVRVLARRAVAAVEDAEFVPPTYTDMVEGLAQAAAVVLGHARNSSGTRPRAVVALFPAAHDAKPGLAAPPNPGSAHAVHVSEPGGQG